MVILFSPSPDISTSPLTLTSPCNNSILHFTSSSSPLCHSKKPNTISLILSLKIRSFRSCHGRKLLLIFVATQPHLPALSFVHRKKEERGKRRSCSSSISVPKNPKKKKGEKERVWRSCGGRNCCLEEAKNKVKENFILPLKDHRFKQQEGKKNLIFVECVVRDQQRGEKQASVVAVVRDLAVNRNR